MCVSLQSLKKFNHTHETNEITNFTKLAKYFKTFLSDINKVWTKQSFNIDTGVEVILTRM